MGIQLVKVKGVAWGWGHASLALFLPSSPLGPRVENLVRGIDFTNASWNVDYGREDVHGGGIVKIDEGQGNVSVSGSIGFRPNSLWGDSTDPDSGGFIPKLKDRFGNWLSIPPLQLSLFYGKQNSATTDNHIIVFKEFVFRSQDFPQSQGDTSFEITMDFGAKDVIIDGMGVHTGDGSSEAVLIRT